MVSLLLKFGAESHMKQLQKDGLLYCKSVMEFAKMENDTARGDKYETVDQLEVLDTKEIWMKPSEEKDACWKKLSLTYAQKKITNENFKGNLFCMSGFPIIEGSNSISISSQFKKFGEYYLLILNQPEFFKRLHNVLIEKGIPYERKLVDYLDLKNFTGKKSIFVKDNDFSWQKEYRIFIKTDVTELQTFNIGNIEDITSVGRLNDSTSFEIRR